MCRCETRKPISLKQPTLNPRFADSVAEADPEGPPPITSTFDLIIENSPFFTRTANYDSPIDARSLFCFQSCHFFQISINFQRLHAASELSPASRLNVLNSSSDRCPNCS